MNFSSIVDKLQTNVLLVVCVFCLFASDAESVWGLQATRTPKRAAKSKQEKVEFPEPEVVVLKTTDGVSLGCTYFGPPENEEKDSGRSVIPFILLHDWEGDRTQLLKFGEFLQKAGHAVIVPDLRGHGASTRIEGSTDPIVFKDFKRNEIKTATMDIERCKKYLVQRNNEGELNIDRLCVVAVGETGALAIQWTINDWFAFPPFSSKGVKQGQDVKSIVLVSPRKKFAGLSVQKLLKSPLYTGSVGTPFTTVVVWSGGDEESKDAESIYSTMEKKRPDPKKSSGSDEQAQQPTLFKVPIPRSRATGVQLMAIQKAVPRLWEHLENISTRSVVNNADSTPWKSREIK